MGDRKPGKVRAGTLLGLAFSQAHFMPNRVIRSGLLDSEKINSLSPQEQMFFVRLMLVVDDYGCYDARPELLRTQCYPVSDIRLSDISTWLEACCKAKLVSRYSVGGKKYLLIPNFDQRLRQKKRKFPAPQQNQVVTNDDGQLSDTCQSPDGQLSDTCQSDVGQMSDTCQSPDGQLSDTCQSIVSHLHARMTESESESESETETEIEGKKKRKHFTPPIYEDFEAFCKDNGYGNIAERAYKGYDASGWHDSQGKPIKNWKQKLHHVWFRPENKAPQFSGMGMGNRGEQSQGRHNEGMYKVYKGEYSAKEGEEYVTAEDIQTQLNPIINTLSTKFSVPEDE